MSLVGKTFRFKSNITLPSGQNSNIIAGLDSGVAVFGTPWNSDKYYSITLDSENSYIKYDEIDSGGQLNVYGSSGWIYEWPRTITFITDPTDFSNASDFSSLADFESWLSQNADEIPLLKGRTFIFKDTINLTNTGEFTVDAGASDKLFSCNNVEYDGFYFKYHGFYKYAYLNYESTTVYTPSNEWESEDYKTVTFINEPYQIGTITYPVFSDLIEFYEWFEENATEVIPPIPYLTTNLELISVADAIRAKGGTNASLSYPNGFVSAIQNIPTSGGGSSGTDVVFYDYDGSIVQSYSASDFASLSAMPSNPTHTGLIAQGWNWSLADAKTHVAKYGKLKIGQMYVTQSGATEIDVEMHEGRLNPVLTIGVNGTITVDWGDNTTPDTVTGTSISSMLDVPHTYASEGNYTINILATESNKYRFNASSSKPILHKYSAASNNENVVYSNTVQHIRIGNNAEIGDNAFYYCYSLSSITIPEGVTSIVDNAFYYCYSLSSITIPESVTSIGGSAFYSCKSLSSITIPDSVTSIGGSAFYSCNSLSSITIPDGVTSIESYTFQYCYSLSSITIPDSVTRIKNGPFYYCYSLSSITIPDSVTSIGTSAFQDCASLSSITIPDGVTSIGTTMFYNCNSLSSITVPNDVTSIGNNAFSTCYGVKEYHILPTTVPTGGTTMFNYNPSDCIIYVPYSADHSVLNAYGTATNWSEYATYMKEEGANGITWAEWQALNA